MVREEAPFWGGSSDRFDRRDRVFGAGGSSTGCSSSGTGGTGSSGSATGGGSGTGSARSAGNDTASTGGSSGSARTGSAERHNDDGR